MGNIWIMENEWGEHWITQDMYEALYHGTPIPAEDFPRVAARACMQIDNACAGRIVEAGGAFKLPEGVQRMVCMAACVQAEWLALNGAESAVDGGGSVDGYNIGQSSITVHAGSGGAAAKGLPGGVCEAAYALLARTGLLYRGVVLK